MKRPEPTARHARHIRPDQPLSDALSFIEAHAPSSKRMTAAEMSALCQQYDDARLTFWRALGPPLLDALGLFGDSTDDALRAVGRKADAAFKLSRPLATTAAARTAYTRVKALRDRVTLATIGLASGFVRTHRGGNASGCGIVLEARGDDALQSAVEYLMLAVDRFDPARGIKFSTYAAHYLRRGVQEARLDAGVVDLTLGSLTRWGEAESAEIALTRELEREPTDDEIAERVNSARKHQTARAVSRVLRPSELGAEVANLAAPGASPEDEVIARDTRKHLRDAIDRALPPGSRQRTIADVVANGGRLADGGAAVGLKRPAAIRKEVENARAALSREVEPGVIVRRRRPAG